MLRVIATGLRPAMTLLVTLALLAMGATSDAAKVKVWQQYLQSHFDKAQLKQAVVTSEGALRLSRQVKPLASLQATNVWDVVEDRTGTLFVATGDEGKLWRVTPDAKASVVFTGSDSQILCLAQGPDGTVYAGTGPSGKVIRVTAEGARVLTDELDSYVWGLVYDAESKSLFAATGPKGRIYQVAADGKAQVYYQTKQEHVLCLAAGPRGTLYAGTDKGGLVYRIDGKNKGFVVYHAHQSEVRSLLVTASAVYAGTSSPTRRPARNGKATTTFGRDDGGTSFPWESATQTRQTRQTRRASESRFPQARRASEGTRVQLAAASLTLELLAQAAAPAPSAPPVGENSVYRIDHDGSVRELFHDKVLVLRLLKDNGKLLVATGMHGQLFEIDEATKEKSELARLDNGQIHCLVKRLDGSIVLGTGDPGKLYVLENHYVAKGTIVGDVLDARIPSKWGAMSWKANTPPGTSIGVAGPQR